MHLKLLARPRLFVRLGEDTALTVLHAAPGSGKTALLQAWANARPTPVVWCTLRRSGTDARGFWSAVVTATAQSGHVSPEAVAHLRDELDRHGSPAAALADVFAQHPGLAVVVDGLERVNDPDPLWEDLVALADDHPAVRLVLGTRWVPVNRLEQVRLLPSVRVLDDTDLAFTTAEISQFLNEAGHDDPDMAAAEQITSETGGHPISVLAAIKAFGESGVGSRHTLRWRELAAAQVALDLERLGVWNLLSVTAVAPYFDEELVSDLTGRPVDEVRQALGLLESNGYGAWQDTTVVNKPVFHLSSSVGEALKTRGAEAVAYRTTGLPVRVCDWLEARGDLGEALVVSARAGLYERATGFYRRLVVTEPFAVTARLEPVLREIPPETIKQYPMLSVARGVALLSSPATQGAATQFLLPIAERAPELVDAGSPVDDLLELTGQSVVLGVLGRPEDAALAALEAARRMEDPAFANAVDPTLVTPLSCQLSQSLFDSGHVTAAQRLTSQGISVARREMVQYAALYGRAWYALDGRMVEAAAMDDRVAEATAHPESAEAGVSWATRTHSLARVGAGTILLDQWKFHEAKACVGPEAGPGWDHSQSWETWVRLHGQLGLSRSTTEVERSSTVLEARPDQSHSLGMAALANVMAIIWLSAGNVARARRTIESIRGYEGQLAPARLLLELTTKGPEGALQVLPRLQSTSGHTVRSGGALKTVAAAAALRSGSRRLATSLLSSAASLYATHGSRAHLLYLPSRDRQALADLVGEGDHEDSRDYLAGLCDLSPTLASPPPVVLSARERQVLAALAAQHSRVDMAQALHVSENTVKSQLRSVYRKLAASDRASAISRAIELDLLAPEQVNEL